MKYTGYQHQTFAQIFPNNRDLINRHKGDALDKAKELAATIAERVKKAPTYTYFGFIGENIKKAVPFVYGAMDGGCFGATRNLGQKDIELPDITHYFVFQTIPPHYQTRLDKEVLDSYVAYIMTRSPFKWAFKQASVKWCLENAFIMDASWPYLYLMQAGIALRTVSMQPERVKFWYKFREELGEDMAFVAMHSFGFVDATRDTVRDLPYSDGHALFESSKIDAIITFLNRDFSRFRMPPLCKNGPAYNDMNINWGPYTSSDLFYYKFTKATKAVTKVDSYWGTRTILGWSLEEFSKFFIEDMERLGYGAKKE